MASYVVALLGVAVAINGANLLWLIRRVKKLEDRMRESFAAAAGEIRLGDIGPAERVEFEINERGKVNVLSHHRTQE